MNDVPVAPPGAKSAWSYQSPLLELFILAVRNDRLHAMKMRENYRRHLPRRAHACESFEYQVVAADASGDLGYIVGMEHTTASVGGGPPEPYSLRVTTILRLEEGEWKVVHRHADPVPDSGAREQASRMVSGNVSI